MYVIRSNAGIRFAGSLITNITTGASPALNIPTTATALRAALNIAGAVRIYGFADSSGARDDVLNTLAGGVRTGVFDDSSDTTLSIDYLNGATGLGTLWNGTGYGGDSVTAVQLAPSTIDFEFIYPADSCTWSIAESSETDRDGTYEIAGAAYTSRNGSAAPIAIQNPEFGYISKTGRFVRMTR